jgi:hypothetical protein
MISVERLKHLKFDHARPPQVMGAQEVLEEYLFLQLGYADDREPVKGIKLGLAAALEARKGDLERFIVSAASSRLEGLEVS